MQLSQAYCGIGEGMTVFSSCCVFVVAPYITGGVAMLPIGVCWVTCAHDCIGVSGWRGHSCFFTAPIIACLASLSNKQNKQKLITPCELSHILYTKTKG